MVKAPKTNEQEASTIDQYKSYIKLFIKNWYWIGLSLIISVGIGFLIIKSSTPQYKNSLTMLLAEKSRENRNSSDLMQFEKFNMQNNIEDELGVISSFPLVYKTLQELNLIISYYSKTGLISKELYKDSPFTLIIDPELSYPVGVIFEIEILSKERFRISANDEKDINLINYTNNQFTEQINGIELNQEYSFGDNVQINNSRFKILVNANYNPEILKNTKLFFKFNDLNSLTIGYKSNLKIERASIQSSLVTMEFKGGNPVLVTDFLNKLASVYLERNLDKKNEIANKTIQFIEGQISEVADSLGYTSDKLKNFRAKNNVMNIDYLSQSVNEQMRALENQKAVLMVKSKYYDYIKEYFENNKELTDLLAPSAMGVEDPQLTSLINQLTTANAERALYLDGKSFKNPNLPNLNAKINNLKKTILENIDYIVNTSNITINDIDNRIAKLNREVYNLPSIEKELQIIQRDFSLNDAIYTFLLTKRSESQIARASNSPDYEIIVPSNRISALQVAPNSKLIFFVAIFLGLMIPIGFIILSSALDDSISDKREIEKLSNFSIIGTIARNDKLSMLPILDSPKSMIAESFRSLRTSLQFFKKSHPKQKILITSSMSGEGKTFLALNLAAAFSYYGKKTLFLEFDLRNPKLVEYLGIDQAKGLSSYLINDARLEDIIQQSNMKNLDIIQAGEIPPNPVELIASDNTRNLFEILQSIYEYIIIDSPPIGVVTDSYILMDYSDANLFAVRLNYTNKKIFSSLLKDLDQKEIPNVGLVINDDEDKTHSVYYYEESGKVSYFMKKFNTFKTLIKVKKEVPLHS